MTQYFLDSEDSIWVLKSAKRGHRCVSDPYKETPEAWGPLRELRLYPKVPNPFVAPEDEVIFTTASGVTWTSSGPGKFVTSHMSSKTFSSGAPSMLPIKGPTLIIPEMEPPAKRSLIRKAMDFVLDQGERSIAETVARRAEKTVKLPDSEST